tara:strand:+ start:1249 stop:1659 length:411 start_codon:yes stop_codon:yes gene_type:complete
MIMDKQVWLNIGSQNLTIAKLFYENMPFCMINTKHSNDKMLSLYLGDNKLVVNLFENSVFATILGASPAQSSEMLMSIGAGSINEVNQWAQAVRNSGGKILAEPDMKDGWMYGFGFADPDGHKWNVLFMDYDKMPK